MLLARAWLYSGDREFLTTLQDLWLSWRRGNPYPIGINWASALEVAFRCLSWIWFDHFASGAKGLPEDFLSKVRVGVGECAVYIERNLSTYFAPNTHLLGEALALFFTGVLYPQFERAPIWRDYGWRVLLRESSQQVREDGFHFEQSVYYHIYALDIFLHAYILASRNNIAIPDSYDRTIELMAEGLASLGAAGQAPRFGDDDGGRLFDGRRNRPEHLLDPLAPQCSTADPIGRLLPEACGRRQFGCSALPGFLRLTNCVLPAPYFAVCSSRQAVITPLHQRMLS